MASQMTAQVKSQELQRRDWYLATLGVVRYVARGSEVDQGVEEALATPPVAGGRSGSEGRAALHQLLAAEATGSPALTSATAASRAAPAETESAATDAPDPGSSVAGAFAAEAETPPVPSSGLPSHVEPGAKHGKEHGNEKPGDELLAADEIEVRLAVWQPAPDLLFFDSMQPGEQPSIQMARLVTNIVAALGRQADGAPVPQLIDWPPARSRVASDLEAARTMVSAFCDARLSGGTVQLAVIMGGDAVRLLQPEEGVLEEDSIRACRWRDLDTVIAPPLSDLLGNPSAKRRLWQALMPFVRH